MATQNKKSRAQKAESEAKKKSGGKGSPKKPAKKQESGIPGTFMAGLIYFALFGLFLLAALNPTGALWRLLLAVGFGLVGKVGFYFAVPVMLYLFGVHIFKPKARVRLMSGCALAFVVLCGSISHLTLNNLTWPGGLEFLTALYQGGSDGTSAGVICGGLAELLRWAVTKYPAIILLATAAVITLLGAMQITIPSLVKAIQNRPREEEDADEEVRLEPAEVVVNRIANRQIENRRKKREKAALRAQAPEEEPEVAAPAAEQVQEAAPKAPKPRGKSPVKSSDMMSQIDNIEAPVATAGDFVCDEDTFLDDFDTPAEPIPSQMPPLQTQQPPEPEKEQPKDSPKEPTRQTPKEPVQEAAAEPPKEKVTARDAAASAQQVALEIQEASTHVAPEYCFPPISLLKNPKQNALDGTLEMRENSRRLNETLASFKIDAHIVNVTRGPSVTRYEVELEKGVRLNKLTGCADDIALSLGASGVRIAAIPGKISVVGIEVPNRAVTNVTLREVIDSNEFHSSKSRCSFAVGKDIGGNCIVGDITKMPHLLIAGTTGSGKSVCMNSIIISLLYKSSPEDVKLIMVDPKMVELGIYNGIPHLLIPVVTDPKKAAGSLQWAVTEMMRRYKTMSDAGVHDMDAYNQMLQEDDELVGDKLPRTVIIIDELADLMMVAAKEVEDSICRIAAMGRAAGIHLIIATQRPSADVITGLMKANIPSRISFAVASAMESRIILDNQGAEKLVGRGDMLYAPIGNGKPLRVQGCFVTDGEVRAVAGYVKDNFTAEYNQQVLEDIEKKAQQTGKKAASADPEPTGDELDGDELLPQAVDVILETGQASVSMLQRRLKLGYARAARIVDEMEEKGYVGPFQGSKPRTILITREAWEAQKIGQPEQMDFSDFDEVPEDF